MKKKSYCNKCGEETEGIIFVRTNKNTMEEIFYFRCKNSIKNKKICNAVTKI